MSEGLAGGPSAGSLLRQAREAAGLHVAALAVALKVPVRKLEALEDDRYEALPDTVFARALASSVCRTLKVDPQPILDRLPQGHAPRLVPERQAINAPFRAPGDSVGPGWFDQLTRPVFLVVFGLLLGALVLIFMPMAARDEAAAKPAEVPGVPMAAPALVQGVEAPAGLSAETVLPPPQATPPARQRFVRRAAGRADPRQWHAALDLRRGGVQGQRPVVGAGHRCEGHGHAATPDGRRRNRRRFRQPAAGRDGRQRQRHSVQVRGKPYDLAAVAKDNVARFEVK
jgi:cytoskeleton protein RodZ